MSLRDRYNAFIERHEVAWEVVFAVLAIVYVVIAFIPEFGATELAAPVEVADTILTFVFVAEFTTRIAASYDRFRYLRGHWIDLIALIPLARGLRVLRLIRLLRMIRAFAGIYRSLASVERLAEHRGLLRVLTAWLAVMATCSVALYAAESGINQAVETPWDALWWGITTMTTVGYGDVYPVTPEGRVAAALLMLLGIGLFSIVTASITSFFVVGDGGRRSAADRLRDLAALRDSGLVTDAEFEAKREHIVGEL
jgi:voltage-gated potassium channel